MKIKRQGIDTFPLKIGVLSRDRTKKTAPQQNRERWPVIGYRARFF